MKKLKLLAIMLVMFTFVATVYAADMSKEFSALLTNGKLVLAVYYSRHGHPLTYEINLK